MSLFALNGSYPPILLFYWMHEGMTHIRLLPPPGLSRCLSLIAGIIWLILSETTFASEAILKEYLDPQDTFYYERTSPTGAILTCHFEKNRFRVRSLALALPEDVTLSWRFLGGRSMSHSKESIITASNVSGVTSWISLKRMWLSDIPICSFRFQNLSKTHRSSNSDKSPGSFSETVSNISEATFELTFSRPFGNPGPASRTATTKDPFLQIAKHLVANPDDLPIAPRPLPSMEVSVAPELQLNKEEPVYRIKVSKPGIVSFAAKDLLSVGFDNSLPDTRYLSLFHHGKPFPLGVMAADTAKLKEDDRFWFFCPSAGTDESSESIYYLGWSATPGARISEATDILSAASTTPTAVSQTGQVSIRDWDWRMTHIEQDHPDVYICQKTLSAAVNIFWKDLRREEDSLITDRPGLLDRNMISREVSSASSALQIRFQLPENYQVGGSLHVVLNELELADCVLPSNTELVSLKVPSEKLRRRGNRLSISFRGKLPPIIEQAHGLCMDWVRVWYPGLWNVSQSLTKVEHAPTGCTGHDTPSLLARWRITPSAGDWRFLGFSEGDTPHVSVKQIERDETSVIGPSSSFPGEWWLVDLNQSNPPDRIEMCAGKSNLRDNTSQADLLVVTDPRFVPQLEEYLQLTQRRGFTSRIATTNEIYEEFSHGEKSIQSIRDYCRYALTHYQHPRPQYLWLVGEARWDPTNRLGSRVEDLVPSPALQTRAVIHSNDQWFVYLFGDDAFPDLLVSRVSVGTTTELEAYLGKVKEDIEDRQLGWWRTTSLHLTDDGFSEEVETCLNNGFNRVCVPELLRQEEYPLDPFRKFEAVGRVAKEARGIRDDVVKEWSEGARLVEYAGHGGITVWSHESLFKGLNRPDSDVDRLTNKGKYSFVNMRSCWSASVNWPTFPGEVSVSEALIKAPARGAIGVLGSSGSEFATDQERFGAQHRAAIWNHHLSTISVARAYAQCQFLLQTPELKGVVDQFLLHGDPTLSYDFPITLDSLSLAWSSSQEGPRLRVQWSGGLVNGKGQARFYSCKDLAFESEPFDIPESTQTITISVPPSIPFKPDLMVALYFWDSTSRQDAFRAAPAPSILANANDWLGLYHSWVKPATGLEPEVSEIVLSPTDPVAGEPVLLTVKVQNNSTDVIQLLNAEAMGGNDSNSMKRIDQEIRKKGGYPWSLFPGETRNFQWLQQASEHPGELVFQVNIQIPGKTVSRSATVMIETPPEIKILELRPLEQCEAYPAGEPLRMLARVQNVGGRPTQSLLLVCSEMRWNQTASVVLPVLNPAQIYDATLSVLAPQTAFDWETRIDLLPKDPTSRTKWHRQSFRSEVPREIRLAFETDGRVCAKVFGSVEEMSSFTQRSLEPGERTFRISDDAQFKDVPVMSLDILDTSDIRSATHAGAAAWQYQTGWWLSPFQLQAPPLWSGKPFKARLPWEKSPILAMISPAYYKHDNYQFVGFPMPSVTIESDQCKFDLTPSNTHADGRFPSQLIELQPPGIDWTIRNHRGAWPGFSGFRMSALPEIITPVLRLPDESNWKPDIEVEWIAQVPIQGTGEIRWSQTGKEWGNWVPLSGFTTGTGNRAQIRYWAVPNEAMKGALIRSLAIRFEKID